MSYYKLDANKNPIPVDLFTWSTSFENRRHVGNDTFDIDGEEIRVSTMFLGLDHAYDGGQPILFETMIFGGDHDGYQERYHTWQEAEEGHKKAVALLLEVD